LIFGEHSRYVDDFNEISYTNIFAQLSPGGAQRALLEGLAIAKRLLQTMIDEIKVTEEMPSLVATKIRSVAKRCVFIGHGRSPLWARVQVFLQNDLKMTTLNYETESRVGDSIVPILEKMLDGSGLCLQPKTRLSRARERAKMSFMRQACFREGSVSRRLFC